MASASRRFRAAVFRLGLSAGMKVFGDELIDLVLREVEHGHFAAHRLERVAVGIGQRAEVGGVHLGVAAETTEILVNHGGIEESVEADSEKALQAVAVCVEIIEVVLEADPLRLHLVGIEHAGHEAAALLFRGKAFGKQIHAGRHEPRARLGVVEDGVGLAGIEFRPVNGAAVEVAGIEQRHGAALGFLAQRGLEAEVHDAPGGDGHAQRGEAGAEAVHGFLGGCVAGGGRDVNELLGVVLVDDFGEGKDGLGDAVALLAAAAGHDHFAGLVAALHRVEDDVLLQHAVFAEGGFAGFEDVEAAQFQLAQEVFAERTEVRAIAKTPGRDADELPTGKKQSLNECDKTGVEVASLDADGTQGAALAGVGADFAIGRIRDGSIEGGRRRAEQITGKPQRHLLNEVFGIDLEREANPRVGAAALALAHRRCQCIQDFLVEFVKGRFDGANVLAFFTTPRDEGQGERTRACASIKQAHRSRKRPEH